MAREEDVKFWHEGMTAEEARSNWYSRDDASSLLTKSLKENECVLSHAYSDKKDPIRNHKSFLNANKYYVVLSLEEEEEAPDGQNGLLKNAIKKFVSEILAADDFKKKDPIVITFVALGLRNAHAANYSCRIDRRPEGDGNEIFIINTLNGYEDCNNEAADGMAEAMEEKDLRVGSTLRTVPHYYTKAQQTCHSCIGLAVEMAKAHDRNKTFVDQHEARREQLGTLCGDKNELAMRERHYYQLHPEKKKVEEASKKPKVNPEKENKASFDKNKSKVVSFLEGKDCEVKEKGKKIIVSQEGEEIFTIDSSGATAAHEKNDKEVYKLMIESMIELYPGQKFALEDFSDKEKELFEKVLEEMGDKVKNKFAVEAEVNEKNEEKPASGSSSPSPG